MSDAIASTVAPIAAASSSSTSTSTHGPTSSFVRPNPKPPAVQIPSSNTPPQSSSPENSSSSSSSPTSPRSPFESFRARLSQTFSREPSQPPPSSSSSVSSPPLLPSSAASPPTSPTESFRARLSRKFSREPSQPSSSSSSFSSPAPVCPLPRAIPYYTAADISLHSSLSDCWVSLSGRVYNVTSYLDLHPGGKRLLFRVAGKDATADFVAIHHSKRAEAILYKYWVGDMVGTKPFRKNPDGLGERVQKKETLGETLDRVVAVGGDGNEEERGSITVKSTTTLVNGSGFSINLVPPPSAPSSTTPSSTIVSTTDNEPSFEYRLSSIIEVTSNTKLLYFLPLDPSRLLSIPTGHHIKVKHFAQYNDTVYRSYTPVHNEDNTITLLVRTYPGGRASEHLHSMGLSSTIRFYGPYGSFNYRPNAHEQALLICVGTGITPIYQLLKRWFGKEGTRKGQSGEEEERTEVELLYGVRRKGEILLEEEIERYKKKFGKRFRVKYFISQDTHIPDASLSSSSSSSSSASDSPSSSCSSSPPCSSCSSRYTSSSGSMYHSGRINREVLNESLSSCLQKSKVTITQLSEKTNGRETEEKEDTIMQDGVDKKEKVVESSANGSGNGLQDVRFQCYVCGSYSFNDEIQQQLVSLGVAPEAIHLF